MKIITFEIKCRVVDFKISILNIHLSAEIPIARVNIHIVFYVFMNEKQRTLHILI